MNPAAANIEEAILSAILAGRIDPGTRLGEQKLADLFNVSRTRVREAMMRLETRGVVQVSARRGWYVVEPSAEEARDAFAARRIVESGILAEAGRPLAKVIRKLREHIADEQRAIAGADAATRAFLLADFHVCLADQMGHRLLCDVLRDLTARTTLVATLFQSTHDAALSCSEHVAIVAALERHDAGGAAELMRAHIGAVAAALGTPAPQADPLDPLRQALQTPAPSETAATPKQRARRLFTDLISANPTPTPTATRASQRRHKEN